MTFFELLRTLQKSQKNIKHNRKKIRQNIQEWNNEIRKKIWQVSNNASQGVRSGPEAFCLTASLLWFMELMLWSAIWQPALHTATNAGNY